MFMRSGLICGGIEDDAEDSQWTNAEWKGVTPPSPSVWLIEQLGSSFIYVPTPNLAAMSPTRSHRFVKERPLLMFSLTFYDTSITVLELS